MKSYIVFSLLALTACTAPADQQGQAEEPDSLYLSTEYREKNSEKGWVVTIEKTEQVGQFLEVEIWKSPEGWVGGWAADQCPLPCDGGLWFRMVKLASPSGELLTFGSKLEVMNYIGAAGYQLSGSEPGNLSERYTFSR